GSDKPFLLLSILRAPPGAEQPRFFVDAARLAAAGDLRILRSGMPTPTTTRFGAFEMADLTLKAGDASRACLAFRPLVDDARDGPVTIDGIACGTAVRPMDRESLAC